MQKEYRHFSSKTKWLFMVSRIQERNNNIIWTWPFRSFFPLLCWYKCTALHLKAQRPYKAFQTFSAESFSKHLDWSKPQNLMWGKSEKALLQSQCLIWTYYTITILSSREHLLRFPAEQVWMHDIYDQSLKFMTDKREVATYFQTWLNIRAGLQ